MPTSPKIGNISRANLAGVRNPFEIILVAGARPNFIKLAPLYHELSRRSEEFKPTILHTGQHYDSKMSDVFFREFELPEPDIHLSAGSGTHAEQTAKVLVGVEKALTERRPDMVVIFGDVNSTLAAAISASKMGVPVAHVEAGLRSFDRSMAEEINRLVADTLADLLLTPSRDADENLLREGVSQEKIIFVGNIMIDTLVRYLPAAKKSRIVSTLGVAPRAYALITMHRAGNVDHDGTIDSLIEIIDTIANDYAVVFPIHPRTRKNLISRGGRASEILSGAARNVLITEPLGYLDFLKLQLEAGVVLTDSGGVQEETTYLGVPCLTLRPNTERPVTITHGTNRLIGLNPSLAIASARRFLSEPRSTHTVPQLWDGHAASRIADALLSHLWKIDQTQDNSRKLESVSIRPAVSRALSDSLLVNETR